MTTYTITEAQRHLIMNTLAFEPAGEPWRTDLIKMLQSLDPVKGVPEVCFGNMRELSDDEIFSIQFVLQYSIHGFSPIPFARALLKKARGE